MGINDQGADILWKSMPGGWYSMETHVRGMTCRGNQCLGSDISWTPVLWDWNFMRIYARGVQFHENPSPGSKYFMGNQCSGDDIPWKPMPGELDSMECRVGGPPTWPADIRQHGRLRWASANTVRQHEPLGWRSANTVRQHGLQSSVVLADRVGGG